jgi:hypothetical protein
MLIATWSAFAPDFDVDTFLTEFDIEPDWVAHHGELRRNGQPWEESGFSFSLDDPEDEQPEDLLRILHKFADTYRPALLSLRVRGIPCTIDIGFTVGGEGHFTRSLRFRPSELSLCVELGITLEVSAYPCGEA